MPHRRCGRRVAKGGVTRDAVHRPPHGASALHELFWMVASREEIRWSASPSRSLGSVVRPALPRSLGSDDLRRSSWSRPPCGGSADLRWSHLFRLPQYRSARACRDLAGCRFREELESRHRIVSASRERFKLDERERIDQRLHEGLVKLDQRHRTLGSGFPRWLHSLNAMTVVRRRGV